MEAAKNRFVKIDGSGDLLQRSMTFACGTAYLIAYIQNRTILPVVTSLWLRVTLASANEWKLLKNRFVKIDGSGNLLPGKRHVCSLRAGVGSSITTHRVRMKLGHENNYSSSVKYTITRERQ